MRQNTSLIVRYLVPLLWILYLAPASASSREASWLFDDFEDLDLLAGGSGLYWLVIGDDQMGGLSEGRLDVAPSGAASSRGALRFSGETRPGFPAPFTGAWAAAGKDGLPRNLTGFAGLRFQARGSGGVFQAGLRSASRFVNFMASFTPGEAWTVVDIPFSSLVPYPPPAEPTRFSTRSIGWVGFTTAPGQKGPFFLEVDAIEFYGEGLSPGAVPPMEEDAGAASPTVLVTIERAGKESSLDWLQLAEDEAGDGQYTTLPDARRLYWARDDLEGMLWFRIELEKPPRVDWLGVNIVIDSDADPENGMNWWGQNKGFKFDRLLTAYLMKAGSRYQGLLGIADTAGIARGNLASLGSGKLEIAIDEEKNAVLLGVRFQDLNPDDAMNLMATVGSSFIPNDDLPDRGFVTLGGKQ